MCQTGTGKRYRWAIEVVTILNSMTIFVSNENAKDKKNVQDLEFFIPSYFFILRPLKLLRSKIPANYHILLMSSNSNSSRDFMELFRWMTLVLFLEVYFQIYFGSIFLNYFFLLTKMRVWLIYACICGALENAFLNSTYNFGFSLGWRNNT